VERSYLSDVVPHPEDSTKNELGAETSFIEWERILNDAQ
jgi:hypothetical protein